MARGCTSKHYKGKGLNDRVLSIRMTSTNGTTEVVVMIGVKEFDKKVTSLAQAKAWLQQHSDLVNGEVTTLQNLASKAWAECH